MTLVLSCITDRYAIHVADRRVTSLNGVNAGQLLDDNRNKIVLVCNRLAFAYSGLTKIEGQSTDTWLANMFGTLPAYRASLVLRALSERATTAFHSIAADPKLKRQAFVAVGWARFEPGAAIQPFIASITNALDDAWNWLLAADQTFQTRILRLDQGGSHVWAATGARLNREESLRIDRELRGCAQRSTGSSAYIRVLVEAIRRVAAYEPTVGRGLLAVSIPALALLEPESMTVHQGTTRSERHVTSMFFPPNQDDGIQYGPHAACPGIVITGTESGAISPTRPAASGHQVSKPEAGPVVLAEQIGTGSSRADAIRPYFSGSGFGKPNRDRPRIGTSTLAHAGRDPGTGQPRPCIVRLQAPEGGNILQELLADPRLFVLLESPQQATEGVTVEWLQSAVRWLGDRGIGLTFDEEVVKKSSQLEVKW